MMNVLSRWSATACLCVLAGGAAEAEPRCLTLVEVRDYVRAAAPAVELLHIEGEEAAAFVAAYNAAPPASTIAADALILAALPGEGVMRLVFFNKGCVTATGRIPAALARRFLDDAARGRA